MDDGQGGTVVGLSVDRTPMGRPSHGICQRMERKSHVPSHPPVTFQRLTLEAGVLQSARMSFDSLHRISSIPPYPRSQSDWRLPQGPRPV